MYKYSKKNKVHTEIVAHAVIKKGESVKDSYSFQFQFQFCPFSVNLAEINFFLTIWSVVVFAVLVIYRDGTVDQDIRTAS